MLIRNAIGLFNPSLLVKICLQFLPSGESTTMCTPFEVSYTGENIVAVTIYDKRQIAFVNVITNTITNTVYIGYECYGTDFTCPVNV
jgi:hypothetical protein